MTLSISCVFQKIANVDILMPLFQCSVVQMVMAQKSLYLLFHHLATESKHKVPLKRADIFFKCSIMKLERWAIFYLLSLCMEHAQDLISGEVRVWSGPAEMTFPTLWTMTANLSQYHFNFDLRFCTSQDSSDDKWWVRDFFRGQV